MCCVLYSLRPRPSPLRDLLRAFNCAGEGNIEKWGRPRMKHHVPIDVGVARAPLPRPQICIHSRAFDARIRAYATRRCTLTAELLAVSQKLRRHVGSDTRRPRGPGREPPELLCHILFLVVVGTV